MGRQALRVLLPAWPGTAFCRKKGRGARRPPCRGSPAMGEGEKAFFRGKEGEGFFLRAGRSGPCPAWRKKGEIRAARGDFFKKVVFPP